jgi:putative tricarboxylic transport membrane protein
VRRPSARPFTTPAQARPVLKVLLPAAGMVVLMQVTGLYVAAAVYIGLYMRWIGRHGWLAVAAVSVAVPIATFLIFETWFLVPMPKGPLEAWLGY